MREQQSDQPGIAQPAQPGIGQRLRIQHRAPAALLLALELDEGHDQAQAVGVLHHQDHDQVDHDQRQRLLQLIEHGAIADHHAQSGDQEQAQGQARRQADDERDQRAGEAAAEGLLGRDQGHGHGEADHAPGPRRQRRAGEVVGMEGADERGQEDEREADDRDQHAGPRRAHRAWLMPPKNGSQRRRAKPARAASASASLVERKLRIERCR